MGKESFGEIYPAIEIMSKNEVNKEFAAQARLLLKLMDDYEPPKPLFENITDEAAKADYDNFKERYGFVIWDDVFTASDEDCAMKVREDPERFEDMSEDDVRNEVAMENCGAYTQLRSEFDGLDIGPVLIYGQVNRWNGSVTFSTVKHSLKGIFEAFGGDENVLFVKDGQLQMVSAHHDGTNTYTAYLLKKDVDVDELPFTAMYSKMDRDERKGIEKKIAEVTESLVPALKEHYGWGI